ncbi:tetratricopeptide repeat protein [Sphingorhabdus wooponensis]|nr:tetratricopeptide repeat-containing protein [Sphingorhabdus wooponensis]
MKLKVIGALIATLVGGTSYAQEPATSEVVYPVGSIGYEALVRGDNERAITDILGSEKISRHDPAKLLNLGRAYARTGRTEEAATLFKAALHSRDNVELVLADGRVMNSKDAAKMAYAGLQTRMASR